ncbi:gliding motility-associated C-terminal domain-containing protein [Dokdonia sinensis]|uniref:Gliding motility-associated C-terminal domain-containing protein n=1 Tax=Dokdonia sinensis TaxID=2479847 RepID=A0A3M0G392_9FLAO|nr:choice-of-anchor L domain-containing protein [Dokdonia sinensis]RMB59440.1 gliding motility-associated C-terminal domain-containing protein [Dokdonia sinensis]
MKNLFPLLIFLIGSGMYGQFIQVDSQSFTAQELIEDILIESDCISDVVVTNVVGGDFQGVDQSYGYFDASGTDFPFENGLVLSTGRLQNVDGPNTTLSDDDAQGWAGDRDLEDILDESNTTNATIIEFDFTSVASEISFRYLFASEEYQENDANTCRFSDLFGFLIRRGDEQQYKNIALVPDTQTPVKVTTVHPEIPGGCAAENEFYFESFNGADVPINFNGQTKILTATTEVIPNISYHVKLVIADEQNFRFDSAVFLEGGSFKLATDLGENRLLSTASALCPNETQLLDATNSQATSYAWFKNDELLLSETDPTLLVEDPGTFRVVVTLGNGCTSFGEVTIEYGELPETFDTVLQQCDPDDNGRTSFNLLQANDIITNNDNELLVVAYYTTQAFAIANTNEIPDPRSFQNSAENQIVYARVENRSGCFSIAAVELTTAFNTLIIDDITICDTDEIDDGFTETPLINFTSTFQSLLPSGATVNYYRSSGDALFEVNGLSDPFTNEVRNRQTLYVRVENSGDCYAIAPLDLFIASAPLLPEDTSVAYCINEAPIPIMIESGVQNPELYNYAWTYNGSSIPNETNAIAVNETGSYEVTVTSSSGCSRSRTITITASELPEVTAVVVNDGINNNSINVTVSGGGAYEFLLDNGSYQENGLFTNVTPGTHRVYIRDINGCGTIVEEVSVIGFPKYFTPNGDGYHDFWRVEGVTRDNPTESFMIFDRFGKLLYTAKDMRSGWNGKYQGATLPTNGYWYKVKLSDGRTFTGGFTLIR